MPDVLPSCLLNLGIPHLRRQPEARAEAPALASALDIAMQALRAVAARVQPVPLSGPVGDDRGLIASRQVGIAEALALALWWNSPAGCRALGATVNGGLVEHGSARGVPPALRPAITLILPVEQHGFFALTPWRAAGAQRLTRHEAALLNGLAPRLARAMAGQGPEQDCRPRELALG